MRVLPRCFFWKYLGTKRLPFEPTTRIVEDARARLAFHVSGPIKVSGLRTEVQCEEVVSDDHHCEEIADPDGTDCIASGND